MIASAQDYAIVNLDLNGRITHGNAGAERLLGYREDAVHGQHLEFTFPEDEQSTPVPLRSLDIALAFPKAKVGACGAMARTSARVACSA
jgi:PAS domain-containing protein